MGKRWEVVICIEVPDSYNAQDVQEAVEKKGLTVLVIKSKYRGKGEH